MTSQLVRAVLDEAEKREAKGVLEVSLIIGEFSLLGIEQMKFSYQILVENTIMKGSRLSIKRRKGKVKCDQCGYEGPIRFQDDPMYHVSFPTLICPQCESPVRIVEGRECIIQNVKLVV